MFGHSHIIDIRNTYEKQIAAINSQHFHEVAAFKLKIEVLKGHTEDLKGDYKQKISALEADKKYLENDKKYLENDKKYLENESKHWRDLVHRLRAENKHWYVNFCPDCGRNLNP